MNVPADSAKLLCQGYAITRLLRNACDCGDSKPGAAAKRFRTRADAARRKAAAVNVAVLVHGPEDLPTPQIVPASINPNKSASRQRTPGGVIRSPLRHRFSNLRHHTMLFASSDCA